MPVTSYNSLDQEVFTDQTGQSQSVNTARPVTASVSYQPRHFLFSTIYKHPVGSLGMATLFGALAYAIIENQLVYMIMITLAIAMLARQIDITESKTSRVELDSPGARH